MKLGATFALRLLTRHSQVSTSRSRPRDEASHKSSRASLKVREKPAEMRARDVWARRALVCAVAWLALAARLQAGKGKGKGKGGNMVVMMGSGGYGGGGGGYGGGGGGGPVPMPFPMPFPMFCGPRAGGQRKSQKSEKIVIIPIPANLMMNAAGGYGGQASGGGGGYGEGGAAEHEISMAPMAMSYGGGGGYMGGGGGGGQYAATQELVYKLSPMEPEEEGERFAGSSNHPATLTSDGAQLPSSSTASPNADSEPDTRSSPDYAPGPLLAANLVGPHQAAPFARLAQAQLEAHFRLPADRRRRRRR